MGGLSYLTEVFEEISPADFFYRNRDIAGFTNPTRAIYSTLRELIENSLDACEACGAPPDVYVRLAGSGNSSEGPETYDVVALDNGCGIPSDMIPQAFGQVLFGSKYNLRQTRGTFGLGGKMAILYGQITTHSSVQIVSSVGRKRVHEYEMMLDIQQNKPNVMKHRVHRNPERWHGTAIEFKTEGDYTRAMPKILEYLKETAIVVPYANLTFVDPKGRFYRFNRATTKMPRPPTESLPHPHGVDVEAFKRIIQVSRSRTMKDFMRTHFQRVGNTIAKKFLDAAGINYRRDPKKLDPSELVKIVGTMKNFEGFLGPDASCLSPLCEDLLETGIRKEFDPEFVAVEKRRPAAYSGFPFIVEVGVAYGGQVPNSKGISLYRFANRVPMLFDESSDVSWKVVNSLVDWRHYKASPEDPVAVFVHLCSTKIPYKTVGKEFIADRPEVEREILNAVRETARKLSSYLSRKHHIEREQRRLDVFAEYLPKIARFSAKLAEKPKPPDVTPLLKGLKKYGAKKENQEEKQN